VHWFEHRLPLEPEWEAVLPSIKDLAAKLLKLWEEQKPRVERYGHEASLEQAFIQPVLQLLGWKLKYQTFLQNRSPDYALFADDAALDRALDAGHTNSGFWPNATLVADAKAWHVSLDRPTGRGSSREYPPEQIEWYLDRSRLDFGILTNGRLWRLIPREVTGRRPRFKTYLEVDLPHLLDALAKVKQPTLSGEEFNDLRRFFLFFSPMAFSTENVGTSLIWRAIQGSAEYSIGVGEDLKERVFEALRICIEGFLSVPENQLNPEYDLELCKSQSLILLYRLLFIMFAEDRSLLPYRVNRTYTRNRSLARHRDQIASRLDARDEEEYSSAEFSLWDDVTDLFDLIENGHGTYGVPAYGGLFDAEQSDFLATKRIPDSHLAHVIDQLGRARDPAHPKDDGLFRVDYRDLAVQQLGGVYEGLLELVPRYATNRMIVVRQLRGDRRTERVLPTGEPRHSLGRTC